MMTWALSMSSARGRKHRHVVAFGLLARRCEAHNPGPPPPNSNSRPARPVGPWHRISTVATSCLALSRICMWMAGRSGWRGSETTTTSQPKPESSLSPGDGRRELAFQRRHGRKSNTHPLLGARRPIEALPTPPASEKLPSGVFRLPCRDSIWLISLWGGGCPLALVT